MAETTELSTAYSPLLTEDELTAFLAAEGLTGLSAAEKDRLLREKSELICLFTKQFFAEREGYILVDGSSLTILPFPYPVLEITKVEEKSEEPSAVFAEVDSTYYKYKRDRLIRLSGSLYQGHDNIKITGTFGWEEPVQGATPVAESAVPYLVKMACKLLILDDIDPQHALNSKIRDETIQQHSLTVEPREQRPKFTGDLEVDLIISRFMYQQPVPLVRVAII
jgi:hypothetical protein